MTNQSARRAPRVALLTLGCAKNMVDSEQMASLLTAAGVDVVHDVASADVAIVNTCGFIQPAKEESIDVILEATQAKEAGLKALVVTGCLSERYSKELADLLPEVDTFTGVDPVGAAVAALEALGMSGDPPHLAVARTRRLTPRAWSYLRISTGCNNRCAYCAIPLIRGPLRSRPQKDLLAEARFLVEQGVRELNVIAQDTANYGADVDGRRKVHELLRDICRLDELRWVRLLYLHPAHVYDELIDVMAAEPKLCPYADIPLQHINDGILDRMGRRVTRAQVEELIEKLRRRIPGVTLRTTFLTGFPGETEAAFEELIQFVRDVRFDRLGCFAFSREEGTAADQMPDQIPREVAEERAAQVMAVQQEIAFDLAAGRVGEKTEILMEEADTPDMGLRPARSPREAPDVDPMVYVEGNAPQPGCFAHVEIVGSEGYDWIARILPEHVHGQ